MQTELRLQERSLLVDARMITWILAHDNWLAHHAHVLTRVAACSSRQLTEVRLARSGSAQHDATLVHGSSRMHMQTHQ